MRTDVLGVGFDNQTMGEAVRTACDLLEGRRAFYVVTPNPEIVWMSRKNAVLKEIITNAALVLPDGIGVIYGAKILGRPLKEKIPGIEFAEKLLAEMSLSGKSVFLLGSKPGVAEKAAAKLTEQFSGLIIAGTADGYFKEDGPVIEKINQVKPDLLMVCLGAPKQEQWMAANQNKLDVGLMVGLGGSLDVFAGTVMRAPMSWRRLHLEWLYRLKEEPKRWTRMIKLPLFIFAVIGQRIRGKL